MFLSESPFLKNLDWEVNWHMPISPSLVLTHWTFSVGVSDKHCPFSPFLYFVNFTFKLL